MFKPSAFKSVILLLVLSGSSSFINAQSVLIQNVTVIDVTGAAALLNRNVLIEDGRIERILAAGEIETSDDTIVIDATDQFLIPGLWDMHTHWHDEEYLPLFIVNGITGIREMNGLDKQYAWREAENTKDYIA